MIPRRYVFGEGGGTHVKGMVTVKIGNHIFFLCEMNLF